MPEGGILRIEQTGQPKIDEQCGGLAKLNTRVVSTTMGPMSLESRMKVIAMRSRNYSLMKIKEHLEGGVSISKVAIYLLIKKYDRIQRIEDVKGKPRPQILQESHFRFIDNLMAENNDLMSRQLHSAVVCEYPELEGISISTVKRARLRISKKMRYCALISENQEKRLDFCKALIDTNDLEFSDVIWTDE